MKTITKHRIISASVKIGSKTHIIKVIKSQLFTLANGIADHLIGNTYHSILRNIPINVVKEKSHKTIIPTIIRKYSFRHEGKRRVCKPSLFDKQPYWLNPRDY